jgi:serine/threonine protein kinase
MEFVAGGELFNYIRAEGQFTNKTAQLVSAEIILALQYLHNQDIIYRDVKPENLLVDHEGHLKLTDFGFAKHIEDKTKSMCGTLDYMAPEILMAKGHGKPVDWWSLGILIYELLSGCPPFTTDKDCKHAVDVISSGRLEFPSYFDPRAVDLIKRLLTLDPNERLGAHEDAEEIKRHPWFEGVDWAKIVRRESPGPMAELKCFKLHFGKQVADNIVLAEEMTRAGPSKTASFDGFEGFRTIR